METTISIFSQFPVTKADRELFVKKTKEVILSGERNPLEFAAYLKSCEMIIDELRKDTEIENAIQSEQAKHGQKSIELFGAKFTLAETGVKYDYSGSSRWVQVTKNIENLNSTKKAIEKMLQSMTEPITTVDEETGETEKIYPPVKTSTTKLTVTLCK